MVTTLVREYPGRAGGYSSYNRQATRSQSTRPTFGDGPPPRRLADGRSPGDSPTVVDQETVGRGGRAVQETLPEPAFEVPDSSRAAAADRSLDAAAPGSVPGRVAPGDCSRGAPTDPYAPSRAYGSSYHELATGRLPE